MPTAKEIIEELKALKVKGYSGKSKPQLEEMLRTAKGAQGASAGGGGGAPPAEPITMKRKKKAPKDDFDKEMDEAEKQLRNDLMKAFAGGGGGPAPAKKTEKAKAEKAPASVAGGGGGASAGKGEITNAVANYYIQWLKGEKGKMEREDGEVRSVYSKHGERLNYVSYNWAEPEITVVNKYAQDNERIYLEGTFEKYLIVVKLLYEEPNKGGSGPGTGVLIYSPEIPNIYKYKDNTLKYMAISIIQQNAGKARMTEAEIATKDKEKEKRISEEKERDAKIAQRKADAEKAAKTAKEDAEKARAEAEISKQKRLDEIESLVETAISKAKSGDDFNTLVRFWNANISPKVDFVGGEYMNYGEAQEYSDELWEKITDAMPPAPKKAPAEKKPSTRMKEGRVASTPAEYREIVSDLLKQGVISDYMAERLRNEIPRLKFDLYDYSIRKKVKNTELVAIKKKEMA